MDEDNIHLQLVTPSEEDTPAQIMEADEDITEIVQVHKSVYVHNMEMQEMEEEIEKEDMLPEDEGTDFEHEESLVPVSHAELKIVPDESDVAHEVYEAELSQDTVYEDEKMREDVKSKENLGVEDDFPVGKDSEERVNYLEHEMKRSKSRMDGFSQELKILLVEVNIVCEWITENFGK